MTALWRSGGRTGLTEVLGREWDLIVIGGGITGAGILLEASRRGLKALLVEQRDFAWGTSSRSSKLVHGGLRYLKEGQFALTRESVQEREHLLQQAAGLVEPQSFAFGEFEGRKPGKRMFLLGLAIYDRMAGQKARHYFGRDEFEALAPNVSTKGLKGGMVYTDAKTDDARLVMRVLQEAQQHGGVAVNYMAVESLLRADGGVRGVRVRDGLGGAQHDVRARLVISATGAWADGLRLQGDAAARGAKPRLRPLRGSHLVLPAWRLPLAQAISLMHPQDGRPVFAFPWEGVTLVGTTDVDHKGDLSREAAITRAEVDYLMAALHDQFPHLGLQESDVIASYAGVRPVIDSGKADPSKEGRDHALWLEDGLLTVTGGKLTTFRVIALDALKLAATLLPDWRDKLEPQPVFGVAPTTGSSAAMARALPYQRHLPAGQAHRLHGRYGALARELIEAAQPGELSLIAGTETIWAQLRWAARCESVQKLEDLLLRRSRIGIQLRGGGVEILGRIRAICQPELGWSDERWDVEQAAYLALWNTHYSLPA
ncbi:MULTISPECIES: glycerol-3-phosphate dehydrogenase/oxidase [unclassified Duganella]|uniref:glycerol-3-phosphate dehydrogenase/oxidase n=1 Tax=unclassified Duganella TaxID=2636909 RepID=UPI000E3451EA|nr:MULTISPECIES: glycerol-3-phosphate dehydrogenase/oxidase [unclassified Duganella]RFP18561.1 glycerol-3-phosphate dehydrogenase/oxidase [Duganella sp. BJB475]RFP35226.1 glycerol-3-phosphate dehydrogenase/oxidase [Duganella sp. BJB476]